MTGLIWDGKHKNSQNAGLVRTTLPFQVVESVNERAQKQHLTLDLLLARQETEWRNRLIQDDKRSHAKGVEE